MIQRNHQRLIQRKESSAGQDDLENESGDDENEVKEKKLGSGIGVAAAAAPGAGVTSLPPTSATASAPGLAKFEPSTMPIW